MSPPLDVSPSAPLVLSFDHRHSFETSPDANNVTVNWDGAVIEVSSDAGNTWTDINTYGDPGYGGTIGNPADPAMNVLMGRPGYVSTNPSWPATDKVTVDLGTALAGTTVQIRFRIGTDEAGGAFGWQIDNIGLQGITNEPFASLVPDTATCGDGGTGGAPAATGAGGGPFSTGGVGEGGFAADALQAGGGCSVAVAGRSPGTACGAEILALAALLKRWARRGGPPDPRRRRARSARCAGAAGGR